MSGSFDWDAMQSFLAVARTGRLTAAARGLGIDHSTLSRRMKDLEDALQTRLFDRGVAGYILTPQGERLVKSAEAMEAEALRILQEIAGSSSKVAGRIRIGAPDGFGTSFLASRLVRMCEAQPDLSVELVTMPRVFSLTKREADLAIGLARPTEGRLHARKLTDYELGLFASTSYLMRASEPRDRTALQQHRLIGYIPELLYAQELDYVSLVSEDVEPAITSANIVAQFNMTLADGGLCILPCFMAAMDPRLKRVLTDFKLIRSLWLIVHADMKDLARVRYCSEFIAKEVRANRKLFMAS